MKNFIMLFLCLSSIITNAQKGKITGTVFDDATGESLIGVTVLIKGTTKGTVTDLDGKFSIETEEGKYDLQISYISYQTIVIEEVQVKANEVYQVNNLKLKESNLELQEVIVTAEAVRTTEMALQSIKQKSTVILDGISSAKMNLIGDATAVEAAKRVTGLSVEEGKYVYVRGLGDRYSKTTLNNVDIPGLDPDRNTLQLDIFPTNLIDNMLVNKNFTADMPADFTGGIMNIETKDLPDEKILSVSINTSYNPDMHFNSSYLTSKGGNLDFLGFDDGTRALPEGADRSIIPTPVSGASRKEIVDFINSFNPELGVSRQSSFLDYSLGFSFGNQKSLKKHNNILSKNPKLGYIFSLSYKSEYKYYDNIFFGEYQRLIDPDDFEMQNATKQRGELGERNILVGIMGGLTYKTNFSKIRLMAIRLQNGENRAGRFKIENDGEAVGQSGYIAVSDNIEYNQRSLTNILLNGSHILRNSGWEIDWRLSPTFSTSDDPDIRKTAFTQTLVDTLFVAGAGGNPSRIWRSLNELNANSKFDVSKNYQLIYRDAKLRFGFSHTYKQRDYEILFFDMQFNGSQSWSNPDPSKILNPENIYPNRPNGIYYQSGNNNPNPNAYESNINNTGLYISNEFSPLPNIKTILGIRVENYVQRHTGRDQRYASGDIQNGRNLDNEKVLASIDVFPSINMIFSINSEQNIRASYSKTIARPSFKELSFAQIIDPITNRIFNGSLFTYSDWDGNLTETGIGNTDLRWELFMKNGQILSVSAFYKKFNNPIELVRIPEQQTSTEYQPRNVGDGMLYGIELEIRKNLEFISSLLKSFNIGGNITFVESQIDMTSTEFNSRKTYEKAGEQIKNKRQMAGQSPYVINAGFSYDNYELGLDAGLFYYVKGPTLTIVGAGLYPDVYIQPFQSLDFNLNMKLNKNNRAFLNLKVSNILNEKVVSIYKSYQALDQIYNSFNPGRSFGLGLSYKF